MKVSFLTESSPDYSGKGGRGLIDGVRGYKDFNINWVGWYANNAEIEISTDYADFNQIKINFLEDQRHWIFQPKRVTVYGFSDGKYEFLTEKVGKSLYENYEIDIATWELSFAEFKKYEKLKIVVENKVDCPKWRKRKFKKPMIMMDEIEIYNK